MSNQRMTWRVIENEACPERCDTCRRGRHECLQRWTVIDYEADPNDEASYRGLVAHGFTSRAEAEAYVLYPETRQHPQPRH
jgi:hypothetical protein